MSSETSRETLDSTPQMLEEQAAEYRAQGRLADAEPLLRRALALHEQAGSPDLLELASPIDQLGHALRDQGKLREAMEQYDRAFELRSTRLDEEHLELAVSLDNRATVLRAQGELAEAQSLLERALEIRRSQLPADHVLIADSLAFSAQLDIDQNRLLEAEQKLVSVTEIRQAALGMAHWGYLESLSTLSDFYARMGRLTAVELLADQTIKDAETSLGKGSLDTARVLVVLGRAYRLLGARSAEAELLVDAMSVFEAELGSDHPEVRHILEVCLADYLDQGCLEDAEPVLERLVEQDSAPSADPRRGARTLEQLANLKCSLGKPAEAVGLLERCTQKHRQVVDDGADVDAEGWVRALNALVDLEAQQGHSDAVDRWLRELLEAQEQLSSPTAPDTLETLRRLAALSHDLGKSEDTLSFYARLAERQDGPEAIHSRQQILAILLNQDRLTEAEPVLERLLESRREVLGADSSSVAETLEQLANLKSALDKPSEVELYSLELLELLESTQPVEPERILGCLLRLAAISESAGQSAEAESWYRRALASSREHDLDDQSTAILSRLVDILWSMGRIDAAGDLVDEGLDRYRRGTDWSRPRVAAHLFGLSAELCRRQVKLFDAEQHYRQSIEILSTSLGASHPEVGVAWSRLADLFADEGRFEEAERLYLQSLDLQLGSQPVDLVAMADARLGMADLYFDMGRGEAEDQFRQAVSEREQAFGDRAPQVADALSGLAGFLHADGRFEEAEKCLTRALGIYEQALSANHPQLATTALRLGEVLCDLRQLDAAEPFLRRALTIREQNLGEDHSNVGAARNQLGLLLMHRGEWNEAEKELVRAREIFEGVSTNPLELATLLSNLATLRRYQERFEESIELYEEVLEVRQRGLGPNDPEVAIALCNLAGAQIAGDAAEIAEPHLQRALEILEQAPGHEPKVPVAIDLLASAYGKMGDFDRSESMYRRSLEIRRQALAADDAEIGYSLFGLAIAEHLQGDTDSAQAHYQRSIEIWQQREPAKGPNISEAQRRFELLVSGGAQ